MADVLIDGLITSMPGLQIYKVSDTFFKEHRTGMQKAIGFEIEIHANSVVMEDRLWAKLPHIKKECDKIIVAQGFKHVMCYLEMKVDLMRKVILYVVHVDDGTEIHNIKTPQVTVFPLPHIPIKKDDSGF